ncbi:hypothetical protein [Alkaliphilus peptidifermentans]|uniref:hypothetical protein n=1 Tax=Alkaliphilus peptidifermentans TaxID=426129 RepID=UPI00115FB9E2|nr:hypothetical protein [Alkaliphilus peptidifermentans]
MKLFIRQGEFLGHKYGKAKQEGDGNINKHTILKITFILLFIMVVSYILGYRLTGLQAAKAHFSVGKDPKYIDEVKYDWGTVYLFDTDEGPRTVISERYIFMWVARTGFHMMGNSDQISVIGWGNNENCTVYAVKILDDKVSYIEMGKGEYRIRKYKDENNQMLFSWDIQVPWQDLNGIAYNSDGKELYLYKLRQENPNTIRMDQLKWYPIEE